MNFKKYDILKSKVNYLFHYRVKDIIVWENTQIMKLEPIDLREPERTGSYEPFIVVNDKIKDLYVKVEE